MRISRASLAALAAVLLSLSVALVLAAGSAADDAGPAAAAAGLAPLPQPASSQPAPPALATSPTATQRTFVSGLGSDSNPCSRTAPCRNFTKAISETLPNGEVIVLDSAGYGPFTVDKSIDIIAPAGVYAGVTAFSGDAITITAASTDRVVLRGLTLTGLGGTYGIHVTSVGELFVQGVVMKRFSDTGLLVGTTGSPRVFVEDTVAHGNGWSGIWFTSGATRATLDAVRLERNGYGLLVHAGAKASVRDSLAASSENSGFVAALGGSALNLERSLATDNQWGVVSTTGATVRISESMVTNNVNGLFPSGGQILSWGTNRVHGNGTDGAPTAVIPQV